MATGILVVVAGGPEVTVDTIPQAQSVADGYGRRVQLFQSWQYIGDLVPRDATGSRLGGRIGTMLRACMYCKASMGTKPCLPEMDGQTSHGCCPNCEPRMRLEMGL